MKYTRSILRCNSKLAPLPQTLQLQTAKNASFLRQIDRNCTDKVERVQRMRNYSVTRYKFHEGCRSLLILHFANIYGSVKHLSSGQGTAVAIIPLLWQWYMASYNPRQGGTRLKRGCCLAGIKLDIRATFRALMLTLSNILFIIPSTQRCVVWNSKNVLFTYTAAPGNYLVLFLQSPSSCWTEIKQSFPGRPGKKDTLRYEQNCDAHSALDGVSMLLQIPTWE